MSYAQRASAGGASAAQEGAEAGEEERANSDGSFEVPLATGAGEGEGVLGGSEVEE